MGGFVLREKLKLIKEALKEWHVTHTKNLAGRINSLKERQAVLDGKGESEELSATEIEELHGISSDIHSLSRANTSISWQHCQLQWLREGDANWGGGGGSTSHSPSRLYPLCNLLKEDERQIGQQ